MLYHCHHFQLHCHPVVLLSISLVSSCDFFDGEHVSCCVWGVSRWISLSSLLLLEARHEVKIFCYSGQQGNEQVMHAREVFLCFSL